MTSTLDIRRTVAHVAEVWLNRPEVRNAFNDGVIAELTAAFTQLGADSELRAIVLGGHGKAFCAGADLAWMRAMAGFGWDENRADAQAPGRHAVDDLPLPAAGGRPHPRRLLRRRRRAWPPSATCWWPPKACSSACQRGAARAAAGDDRALRHPRARRAGARRYFVTAERFDAAARAGAGLRARGRRRRRARRQGRRDRRHAGRPTARPPLRPASAWCRTSPAGRSTTTLRADTARRIADIRASDEGKRRRAELPRQARPGLAGPRVVTLRARHDAAGRDRRGARLGQRPAPVRGGLPDRPGRLPGLGAAADGLAGAAAAGAAVGQRRPAAGRVLRRQGAVGRLAVGRGAHLHPHPRRRRAGLRRVRRRPGAAGR